MLDRRLIAETFCYIITFVMLPVGYCDVCLLQELGLFLGVQEFRYVFGVSRFCPLFLLVCQFEQVCFWVCHFPRVSFGVSV